MIIVIAHIKNPNMFNKVSQPNKLTTIFKDLPVLSWNIHDVRSKTEGLKTDDGEFVDTLLKSTIFCLQETKQEIFLPNYKCFNSTRNDSRSGGVCIGIHRSLAGRAKELKTNSPDFQAVTMSPKDGKKFTIINVYDSPEQSSYKAKRKAESNSANPQLSTLELIEEFRAQNPNIGDVLMVGDFNARTGDCNVTSDELETNFDPEDSLSSSYTGKSNRISKDTKVNSRGSLLLDFLASNTLQLLNGCTLGDIFGEYTSVNYNGCSVVDYMAATPDLKDSVLSFRVLELTKFSDHKPCLCTLKLNNSFTDAANLLDALEDVPSKYKWNNDNGDNETRFQLVQNLPEFRQRIESISSRNCGNSEDVNKLNEDLVSLYQDIAEKVLPKKHQLSSRSKPSTKNRIKRHRMRPKSPWFDGACIMSKRELNRLAKSYGKDPTNQLLRDSYYAKRKSYKKLIKAKKSAFIEELSKDVESGKNVNWKRFKNLKDMNAKGSNLDVFDMLNFCKFFKDLYSKPSLDSDKIAELKTDMTPDGNITRLNEVLDQDITAEELSNGIRSLRKNKAVSEDTISNEFLRSSGQNMQSAVLHLFNQCLSIGVYPWGTSVVTPLHKKGSIYDPNNYRAIAVASNLGKLFASILLNRLIEFRAEVKPDTPNQLGFCKGAQTADHILTLSTCIEKYVKANKKRVYACFVDYAKAFDTVCREALLYKLWKLGIQGRFFRCIEYMYSNSSAKIKLLNKLSEKIDVLCGTEQGHPMSPELFKIFVHALSEELNELNDIQVPTIASVRVTHLLWADDLVLLALDPTSLEKMLTILYIYCQEWGLTVNISKTAIMVFNRSGRMLKESKNFTYGQIPIGSVREYTYLGITFTLTGSLKMAQIKLRQKSLRSYFSLKTMINLQQLKKPIVFKLFDSLIVPVASYCCQIWLPQTQFMKSLSTGSFPTLQKISEDPLEKVHISFLKWTLNLNKTTSNAAVWGDSGRYPLAVELSAQVFSYWDRLNNMGRDDENCLVRYAFEEQQNLNLSWYNNIAQARNTIKQHGTFATEETPLNFRGGLRSLFEKQWDEDRANNRKLQFYNSIKKVFGIEKYLLMNLSSKKGKTLARFRTSSHRFNVETGRYGSSREHIINRVCKTCSTQETDVLYSLAEMPFFDPIIEDEVHVLRTCALYEDLRHSLSQRAKTCLFSDMEDLFIEPELIKELTTFLNQINGRRFGSEHHE